MFNFVVLNFIPIGKKLFNPIKDKSGEIIECLMSSPDMPTNEDLRFKIRLSIEETVENVVQYAYKDSIGWMEVETNLDDKALMLTVTLKDAGKPFNPLEMPDPTYHRRLRNAKSADLAFISASNLWTRFCIATRTDAISLQ